MDFSAHCIVHIPVMRIIKEVFLEDESKYIHWWKCSATGFDFQWNVGMFNVVWFLYRMSYNLSKFVVQCGAIPLALLCELAQSDFFSERIVFCNSYSSFHFILIV